MANEFNWTGWIDGWMAVKCLIVAQKYRPSTIPQPSEEPEAGNLSPVLINILLSLWNR